MAEAAAAFMDNAERAEHAGERGLARATATFSIQGEASSIGAIYEKLLSDTVCG
jgi:mannosyltransferase